MPCPLSDTYPEAEAAGGDAMKKARTKPETYPFTATELEWLTSFRAAVAAGLYGEWDLGDGRGDAGVNFPASPLEITRLLACRRAVAAGFYRED